MRISVALAAHDGERYLLAQLRSLACQTQLPEELVLYDDCSSDGTLTVVERFRRQAPFPVRVVASTIRSGPHEGFIRAASACRGDAIAFCDQDDVWLERKLERCAEALSGEGVLLTVHAASVVRYDLRPTGRRFPHFARAGVVEAGAVDPWLTCPGFAMVFRRSVLDWGDWAGRPWSRHWRGPMTHDEWITLLATAGGRTAFVGERLALYRQHHAQMFGAPGRGPRATLGRLRRSPPEAHEEVADLQAEHAGYLRHLAHGIEAQCGHGRLPHRLVKAAEIRERSALIWRRRALLHRRGLARRKRLIGMARLVRDGGYDHPRAGGVGRPALVHDTLSVLAG